MEVLSYDEEPEPNLRDVMSLLALNDRLSANEERVDNITSHRVVPELVEDTQPGSSRSAERRGRPTSAPHQSQHALHEIEEQVHVRITDHLIGVPTAFLPTMDDESGADYEALAWVKRK